MDLNDAHDKELAWARYVVLNDLWIRHENGEDLARSELAFLGYHLKQIGIERASSALAASQAAKGMERLEAWLEQQEYGPEDQET